MLWRPGAGRARARSAALGAGGEARAERRGRLGSGRGRAVTAAGPGGRDRGWAGAGAVCPPSGGLEGRQGAGGDPSAPPAVSRAPAEGRTPARAGGVGLRRPRPAWLPAPSVPPVLGWG